MISFSQFKEENTARAFLLVAEKTMSAAQMKKREEIAQSMSDEDFKKRYGKDWKSVKMATATKQAMKEDLEEKIEENEDKENSHYCAKHVFHHLYGEGVVLEGEHAEPDEEGKVEWYTVEFDHGKETVFTEDVEVMIAEYHMNHKRKKKMSEARGDIKEPMHPQTRDYGPGHDEDEEEEDEEEENKPKPNQKKKMSEELVGNQHKIDMNKNNKIDAEDFKMLKKIKNARAK